MKLQALVNEIANIKEVAKEKVSFCPMFRDA